MKYRLLKELYDCSFISGFTLAWKLSAELNNCENERLPLYSHIILLFIMSS